MVMMWCLCGCDVAGESDVIVSGWKKNHFKDVKGVFKRPCSLSIKVSYSTKFKGFFMYFPLKY